MSHGRSPRGAEIRWGGHATVRIDMDGVVLLTDPLLRPAVGPLRRYGRVPPGIGAGVDAVLLSHSHHDHLDWPSLTRMPGLPLVVVPRGMAPMVRRHGILNVRELEVGEATEVGAVRVQAVPARHRSRRGRMQTPAVGFVVTGSRRIYFAGDTDLFGHMTAIAPPGLDLALLPVGGWGPSLGPGHMDAERAAQALALLHPRVAVPIHWGTLYAPWIPKSRRAFDTAPGPELAARARETAPDTEVRVLAPGQSTRI